MDLQVTPHGNIAVRDLQESGQMVDPGEIAESLARGRGCGLLRLVGHPLAAGAPCALSFFRSFASEFMRYFCAHADSEPLVVVRDGFDFARFAAAVPPMIGSEHVTVEWLEQLFDDMLSHITGKIAEERLSPRAYLGRNMPGWETVGLVHFHMAENQKDAERPFAFLATYSVRVADKARLQHRPLAAAIGDSLRQGEAGSLAVRLMAPLQKAAETSGFVRRSLLADKGIYRQLFLTAREAFEFLSEIDDIEKSGIVCRVPASWQKGRPARAKLRVTLGGESGKSHVGFGGLLDFKVSLAIGEEELSEEAARELLDSDGPLILVRGQWVEVDSARLKDLLTRWRAAMGVAQGRGVSFGEAMRMIQGFSSASAATSGEVSSRERDLCQFVAGEGLKQSLDEASPADDGALEQHLDTVLTAHLKTTLRPYQRDGVSWMMRLWRKGRGGCLADDMGLGKTVQLIALLLAVKDSCQQGRSDSVPPTLLVVPASLLFNWQAELRRFAPSLRFTVLHASAGGDSSGGDRDVDLVMTTYGMLVRMTSLWNRHWNMVIADEAQNIKNAQTKKSQALRNLSARAHFALTGTPVENSIADLWAIFDFACPGLLGSAKVFSDAVERLAGAPQGFAPLKRLIAPYLLRRKKSDRTIITDLPDKIEVRANCFLTKRQAKLYQKQVEELGRDLGTAKDDDRRKGLVLVNLMKLKQICNHPSQAIGDEQYQPSHSGKFVRLGDLSAKIALRQEKLLVFTQFREITDILAHYLAGIFGLEGCVLHGGIGVDERRKLVEQFQKEDGPPFFVLSLKAGGAGLNLTAAAHVIHFDRWWNPAVENQATDRAFRIGQRQNVMVHKFVCPGTIEDKIDKMLLSKGELAFDIVEDLPRLALGQMGDDELMGLVSLDPEALAQASGSEDESDE